ncbi:DUF6900 domain-containing protein [Limnohabitans lacus]|uniref:DUF6900 domain-containing protein n=1 Tax=Limnohabitans lacus TaxID=3045173 RepID=A0ABT6X8Q8_9BURK|nr:hypothetical protein [Limnohabitans sp. HM2-2]MDI9234302.1 hypothetical protein [Limnohabitans sp. HM2-2]
MTTQKTLEQIAQKHLGLETLQTQKSDRLDFHDLAVWSIEAALKAAFEAGRNLQIESGEFWGIGPQKSAQYSAQLVGTNGTDSL